MYFVRRSGYSLNPSDNEVNLQMAFYKGCFVVCTEIKEQYYRLNKEVLNSVKKNRISL